MNNGLSTVKIARPTYGWVWLGTPFVLLAVYGILGWFDTTTEITPTHDSALTACFLAGGLGGLLLASVAVIGRQEMTIWRRMYLASALAILGFLSVFLLSSRIAKMVEARLDFPTSQTRTYSTFLVINRAYRTEGKGRSWNIQTMPIWSNLDITEKDTASC